jgi:hypothetical protein
MRRSGGLLEEHSTLPDPGEEVQDQYELQRQQTELWDRTVLAYIETRVRDDKFRKEIQAILKRIPAKRGAKPRNNFPPRVFYHLLRAEKRAFKSKTIREALEKYCQMRGLSPDLVDSLKSKYEEGQKRKNRGNSE